MLLLSKSRVVMIAKIAAVVARTCSVGAFVPRNPGYGFVVGSVGVLLVDGLVVGFGACVGWIVCSGVAEGDGVGELVGAGVPEGLGVAEGVEVGEGVGVEVGEFIVKDTKRSA